MSYWTAAQLQPMRDRLALHCLALAGFEVYQPRLREHRLVRGRPAESALFPGYAFVSIELQWCAARWCPGVVRLIMDGVQPARVPDTVIKSIRDRERDGVIELPGRLFKPGDRVRLLAGPFRGHLAIYASMSGPERRGVAADPRRSATRYARRAACRSGNVPDPSKRNQAPAPRPATYAPLIST
jgi:transcriptional antiterminator RfaH